MLRSEPILLDRRGGNLGKRRNGLQPACEGCRKAKVRCDITISDTACTRCRRRKNPTNCIFLEAPMTQSKRESTSQKTASPQLSSSPQTPLLQTSLPSASSPNGTFRPPGQPTTPAFSVNTPISSNSVFSQVSTDTAGYLGLTSYSATLQHELHPLERSTEPARTEERPNLDPYDVALGVHILKHIPDERTSHTLLNFFLKDTVGVICLPLDWMQHIFSSIFSAFGDSLKYPHVDEELEKTSRRIIENGQAPVAEMDDASEFLASMSGENIRWDMIGCFLVACSYAILATKHINYTPIEAILANTEREISVSELKRCIEGCVQLSKGSLHLTSIILLYKNLFLETVLRGDSSLPVWRLHHDLAAVSTALGLHCYQGTPAVTVRSEMTKKLSAICFSIDKELAMFTGRPPALSHLYYSCPLPLDLDDDVVIEGGERLRREIEALDENGWNQKGAAYESTRLRVQLLSSLIQNEVLELFLGNAAQFSMERVNSLKTRLIESLAGVPHLTTVTKEHLITADSSHQLWRLLYGRLDFLRTQFLLERLSVERGHENKQKLIDISREMVDLTVFLWMERDRTMSRSYDFDYIIMCYGMPSAGILSAELLKQVRYPKTVDVKLPCSEVVQNLSFMIGFLEWVKPEAGNYKLCKHMAQVIKRVLDHVFDPPPAAETPSSDQQAQFFDANIWSMNGIDDFDWFNSIDWGRGPFPDMPAIG